MVNQRIAQLQEILKQKNLAAIIIPTQDFHMSEYVGEYFKTRKYFSGFTGSAGVMVITQDKANLWTDGRYFIQAPQELKGTCVTLQKMGEEGVPTVKEYIKQTLKQGDILCFDGRVISAKEGKAYKEELAKQGVTLHTQEDLADLVWKERPAISTQPAYELAVKYSGKTAAEKLTQVRAEMEKSGADVHILTSLDDIAWLFNIRGNDVEHTPVVLSYAAVTKDEAILFASEKAIGEELRKSLAQQGVSVKEYNDIYAYSEKILPDKKVMLDPARTNYAVYTSIRAEIIEAENPTTLMKAVKNPTEITNIKEAQIKDCVAVTKFMYWLKTNIGKKDISEVSAQNYLAQLRSQQTDFVDLSFSTIAGYKDHAAMMHYSATEETDVPLKAEGMLLVDSGGHYLQGTTDITRTFVLGDITPQQKKHFTAVVRSVMAFSNTKFLYGCRGVNFDIIAREPLWEMDLDYKCGTGHGVGYLLSVHEGPNGFRWKVLQGLNESAVFEEGMITTIEPGVYIEGSHGIRIENEILCRKGEKNEYGQFMHFETITFTPIDLDGIDPTLMSQKEKNWLNSYHTQVFATISPYLTADEKEWLKEYTRAI